MDTQNLTPLELHILEALWNQERLSIPEIHRKTRSSARFCGRKGRPHMNLIDVAKQFGTPEACNDFLEQMRWPEGVECVHCASKRVSKYVKQAGTRMRHNAKTGQYEQKPVPARILYVCLDCKKQFSVTEGTIFNDTHLPLEKWFYAVALMVNGKKGVSALQLKRDLGTAYKTSWYLSMRIRKALWV